MTGDYALLDSMIGRLRALGTMPEDVARTAAPLVQAAARATAAAGTSPTGTAWARKRDGGRAMVNAAAHITARAIGKVISIALAGVDVFHHYSKAYPRQVIPFPGEAIPKGVLAALNRGAELAFRKAVTP